jgi:hypothetical protein
MARSVIEKVLATIDAKIAALQLARAELLAQQQARRGPARRTPKAPQTVNE